MPRLDYKNCRNCGRHASEVGELSHTRLCPDCGRGIFRDNLDALTTMSGPFALHWRERVAASVGAVLPARLDTHEQRR